MMLRCSILLVVVLLSVSCCDGAAIPIWELLSKEEKLGRLFYVFVHLVQQYCKTSDIPDCPKVLTLYGLSNLVSEDEHSLDLMDPYQRDAKIIVWERIMRGEFKLPAKLAAKSSAPRISNQHVTAVDENDVNDVDSAPYQVRVRPPVGYVPPPSPAAAAAAAASQSKSLILRLGRSLANEDEAAPLPLLSEQDAHWLSAAI